MPSDVVPQNKSWLARNSQSLLVGALATVLLLILALALSPKDSLRAALRRAVELGAFSPGGVPRSRNLAEVALPSLPTSRVQCNDPPEWKHRVCWIENLYLLKNSAVFVTDDSNTTFPELALYEYKDSSSKASDYLVIRSQEEAASLFASHLGSQAPAGASGGQAGWRMSGEEPKEWSFRIVEKAAAVYMFPTYVNWWHAMDDAGKTFVSFCKYLDLCTYARMRSTNTAVLLLSLLSFDVLTNPIKELFSCYGDLYQLDENVSASALSARNATPVTLVRTAVFGIGDQLVHPYMTSGHEFGCKNNCIGYLRANDTIRLQQIHFLKQCAGVPLASPRQGKPIVRILNREYLAGRAILGTEEIWDSLRAAPKSENLSFLNDITFTYTSGTSFAEQVRLYANTDIALITHGAGSINLLFLPQSAVVINVFVHAIYRGQEEAVVKGLPKPDYNVSFLPFDCPDCLEPIRSKLAKVNGFDQLPIEKKLHLILKGSTVDPTTMSIIEGSLTSLHQAMYAFNIRPPIDKVVEQFLKAGEIWLANNPSEGYGAGDQPDW